MQNTTSCAVVVDIELQQTQHIVLLHAAANTTYCVYGA
jgi:hypothetical protein